MDSGNLALQKEMIDRGVGTDLIELNIKSSLCIDIQEKLVG